MLFCDSMYIINRFSLEGYILELRQLHYFVEVAKFEHMTKASEQLHVAQSAISRQITNLEDELGVTLFNRMGRNLHLSKIGELYLAQVKIALNELNKATNIVSEYANPEIGTVKIGFPTSLATNLVPKLISSFRRQYPDVNYQFVEGSNKELNENLLSGNLDLTFFSPLPEQATLVDTFTFFEEKLKLVVPKNHPLNRRTTINLVDLKNEKFIFFPETFSLYSDIINACESVGFKPDIIFQSADLHTINGLVEAGLGIAILPEIILADAHSNDSHILTIENPSLTRTVGIGFTLQRRLSPSEQLFKDFLIDHYTSESEAL